MLPSGTMWCPDLCVFSMNLHQYLDVSGGSGLHMFAYACICLHMFAYANICKTYASRCTNRVFRASGCIRCIFIDPDAWKRMSYVSMHRDLHQIASGASGLYMYICTLEMHMHTYALHMHTYTLHMHTYTYIYILIHPDTSRSDQ